ILSYDRYSSGANGDTFNRTLASSSGSRRVDSGAEAGYNDGDLIGENNSKQSKFQYQKPTRSSSRQAPLSMGFSRQKYYSGLREKGFSNGDTFQSRSGRGSGRGKILFGLPTLPWLLGTWILGGVSTPLTSVSGYKGLNEEVITGSGKKSWKSEAKGGESGDTQGRKVTYVPPPPPDDEESIFAHYQTGINFDKYDTILVEVSGHDPPPAILTFEEANLCQILNKNIAKAGYTKLTPVQKYSIPIILGGRDLMACAQTGSGKTAAFLLPILAHMMRDGTTASHSKELQEPECIIVAPTRELISQIYSEARKFSFGTCIRAVVTYGGTPLRHSIRQIVQGCNILCATPGRLMDIIGKEKIGLRQVKYLVLDEADHMLDMGFGPEMKKLISCPGMPSKEQRQTLMFSATFPEEIQRLAGKFLKSNYLFVAVGQVGGACTDVQQTILQVGQYSKREKLVGILQNIERISNVSLHQSLFTPLKYQFSSFQSLSRVRLCDPMNRSTPGLPVHHQLPEFTQTHVHRLGDAVQPSHPLSSLLLLPPIPPSIRVFSHEGRSGGLIFPSLSEFSSMPPGGGHGSLLQYSCLENPMDRVAWRAIQSMVSERVGHH
ncbi:hypothetical protein FD755_024026, partial [Muntiacus reevesi]